MRACAAIVLSALFLSACAASASDANSIAIGPLSSWPAPQGAPPGAPPHILAAQLSSNAIRVGDWWSGRVVTTTNVAVVELRAPSFSFILHRSSFGEFSFHTHVLAIPSLYRRPFLASLIARNAAGRTDERDVELAFR